MIAYQIFQNYVLKITDELQLKCIQFLDFKQF